MLAYTQDSTALQVTVFRDEQLKKAISSYAPFDEGVAPSLSASVHEQVCNSCT
jgi:hypothetical protein